MFGIDSSNSLPDYAIIGCLEDGSWFMWKMQTHISCTIPPKPNTRTAFVAESAVRLATDSKTAPVNGSSIRPWFLCLESGKTPSCRMTAATKGWYSPTIDYRRVVKPLGGVLD